MEDNKNIFDYSKLRGRIKEKGYTQEEVAKNIGIDKSTLSLRLNNQSLFVQDELNKIIKLLDIPGKEIKSYFFEEKV